VLVTSVTAPAGATSEPLPPAAVRPWGDVSAPLTPTAAVGISRHDIWMVAEEGSGADAQSVIRHWDGSTWSAVPPDEPDGELHLSGIDAAAQDDVWAVGGSFTNDWSPLAEHWDGHAWKLVQIPDQPHSILTGIDVVTSADIWASGWVQTNPDQSYLDHWDGVKWTMTVSTQALIEGVTATPSGDVYGPSEGQIAHWNGSTWAVGSPAGGYVNALDAIANDDVWAVGSVGFGRKTINFASCWNGQRWVYQLIPPGHDHFDRLVAVTADSPDDVWATSQWFTKRDAGANVWHWDGAWHRFTPPGTHSSSGYLSVVVATAPRNVWVFGSLGSTFDAGHWNGLHWKRFSIS
jgi:hypothetical protein